MIGIWGLLFALFSSIGYAQSKYYWGLLGEYPGKHHCNPYTLTRDDHSIDVGAIINIIDQNFVSAENVAKLTKLPIEKVNQKLLQLENCELVLRKNNKFIANFFVFNKEMVAQMNKMGEELANKILEKYVIFAPKLRKLFEQSSLVEAGFTWQNVSPQLVGGLILDIGINDKGLNQEKIFLLENQETHYPYPGGFKFSYFAFEGGWGDQFWKFGHEIYDHRKTKFGHFRAWHKGVIRPKTNILDVFSDPINQNILQFIVSNHHSDFATMSKVFPIEHLQNHLDTLLNYKIIMKRHDLYLVNFPVFQKEDVKILLHEMNLFSIEIVQTLYHKNLPTLLKKCEKLVPKSWNLPNMERTILRNVVDRASNIAFTNLIKDNHITQPSQIAPFHFWAINDENYSMYK